MQTAINQKNFEEKLNNDDVYFHWMRKNVSLPFSREAKNSRMLIELIRV